MPKRAKAEGSTVTVLQLVEEKRKLEGELLAKTKELDDAKGKLQLREPLLLEAAHALSWALSHPDFGPGGKFHSGALGTAYPALKQLNATLGNTGGSSGPVIPAAAEPAAPVAP